MTCTRQEVREAGGYEVILADPPWSYADRNCNGAAAQQYKTMSVEQIMAMPVSEIASKNCALFLWATYPLLPQALAVIDAWGFQYKSIAFQWVKFYEKSGTPFFGLGRWTRGNTEPCLLATRGKPKRAGNDVSQLIIEEHEILTAPIGRHSAKPKATHEKIVRLMGDVPRIELFAREEPPDWDVWGNEVECAVDLSGAA